MGKPQFGVSFDGEGSISSVWRKDARDRREDVPNEVPAVDGCKGPLLPPPFNSLMVRAAFYQPQGWENPFKPNQRKGKQGLQEVVDAYEQHLCQSRVLLDRLPELSGKVFYCHCKPTDPCHADALLRAWEQNVDGPHKTVAPGVGRIMKRSLTRLVEKDKLSLIGWFRDQGHGRNGFALHCQCAFNRTIGHT